MSAETSGPNPQEAKQFTVDGGEKKNPKSEAQIARQIGRIANKVMLRSALVNNGIEMPKGFDTSHINMQGSILTVDDEPGQHGEVKADRISKPAESNQDLEDNNVRLAKVRSIKSEDHTNSATVEVSGDTVQGQYTHNKSKITGVAESETPLDTSQIISLAADTLENHRQGAVAKKQQLQQQQQANEFIRAR